MVLNLLGDELDKYKIDYHIIIEAEQRESFLNSDHTFKVLSVNIRNFRKNIDNLIVPLKRLRVHYEGICLTECSLDENTVIP